MGCLGGWIMGGIFIPLGIVLCFTGVGAILGVPLILAGLFGAPLGSMMGLGALNGECPWCGTQVTSPPAALGVDCPACKKRIVIKGKKFIGIE